MLPGPTLAIVTVVYCALLIGIGAVAQRRVKSREDFLVAGRRLSLPLATATLMATWFGAGTLLTVTDEVRANGLRAMAMDPLGAGLCLALAGVLLAGPLWRMRLHTLAEFYGRRFGPRAEKLSAVIMVPGYFGWVAAQFVALASVLQLAFGLPLAYGIVAAAGVGLIYTWMGGMWSVTLTDALQMFLVVLGLVWLAAKLLLVLGHGDPAAGWTSFVTGTAPEKLQVFPSDGGTALVAFIGLLAAGCLGNLPGQDLTQRIFAARSARTARWACLLASAGYLTVGLLPPLIGLAADRLVPAGARQATLPLLAGLFLDPFSASLFLVAVLSAVLSTIDSALLAPASVLAENLAPQGLRRRFGPLAVDRAAVALVAAASLAFAFLGQSAYELLEVAYEVGLAGLAVPLIVGVRSRWGGERAALACMTFGTGIWLPHVLFGWDSFLAPWLAPSVPLPTGLSSGALGLLAYAVAARSEPVGA